MDFAGSRSHKVLNSCSTSLPCFGRMFSTNTNAINLSQHVQQDHWPALETSGNHFMLSTFAPSERKKEQAQQHFETQGRTNKSPWHVDLRSRPWRALPSVVDFLFVCSCGAPLSLDVRCQSLESAVVFHTALQGFF